MSKTRNIKIMHVLYSFDMGGMEKLILSLVNGMDQTKFSHSLCVFSNRLKAIECSEKTNLDIFVVRRFFPHDPTLIFRLIVLFKKIKPDILRTYNWGSIEGIIAAMLSGIRVVIHSEHGFGIDEIVRKKYRRVIARRILLNWCAIVIAVSRDIQTWLIDDVKIDKSKVNYMPNGVDTNKFNSIRNNNIRHDILLNANDIVIGTVGTLKELKGFSFLVQAFYKLAERYNNLKLIFVGDGPQRNQLESMVTSAGLSEKVFFIGQVNDPSSFYKIMNIFVLPSLSENFPNVILEAMASGLPIVATDVGDVKYMLDGMKGGVIIKPKDADSIFHAVEYLLENPSLAKGKGDYARKRAVELFSIDRTIRDYETLYCKMCNRNLVKP